MLLIEETHYRRRLEQPSPAPKPSKQIVDCLLCGDPTLDPDEEHDVRKRTRSKGRNIRLDRLQLHITRDHPDAAREGSRSLTTFGFTRQPVRVAAPSTVVVDPPAAAMDDVISSAGLPLQGVPSGGLASVADATRTPIATAIAERNTRTSNVDF